MIKEGEKAPKICLKDAYEKEVCPKGNYVLYFYPKDNTPGCSLEAMDFSRLKDKFESLGVKIYGISKDTCKSHQKFIDSKGLTITLLSDPDSEVQKKYGVWRPKKFMGKEFLGTIRSSYLISKNKIVYAWDNVKAKGHAEEVLEKVKEKI